MVNLGQKTIASEDERMKTELTVETYFVEDHIIANAY